MNKVEAEELARAAETEELARAVADEVVARLGGERPQLLRIEEAAKMLGLSGRTVRTMINEGTIASVSVAGGARRVELSVVQAYVAARRGDAA